MRYAQREFGSAGDGVGRIMAILEWIHGNVGYVAGVSDAVTTAEQTFIDRAGVWRDFTHLGITLARALGIPARTVSAYALQLDPRRTARRWISARCSGSNHLDRLSEIEEDECEPV
jgi:transglutaminase-like putative cysteine protease